MEYRMLKEKRLGIAILALTLAAVLLITACAPGPPTEEKQVVKIGYIAPLTGPGGTATQVGWRNMVDYLKYFEEVDVPGFTLPPGVTIELVWVDSAYDASRAISAYETMRDVLYLQLPSPMETYAIRSRMERDGIAGLSLRPDEELLYPPSQIFAVFPTESERFAAVCDWIMENWREGRPPRVAMMGPDSTSGHSPEVMGTPYAKSIGIEMLPYEAATFMALDTTTQLLRLKEEGADYVFMTGYWPQWVTIMMDAERLGLIGKIRFTGATDDSMAIELLEALGPAAEGYFGARSVPWYTETPILYDILREYQGKLDTSGGGAATLLYVTVPVEAIRIAIEELGYENLNARAVTEAMYSIKDFDPYHIGTPRTYTREDNRGSPKLRIYQVQGGEVVPVTDWRDSPMLVPQK